MPNGIFGQLPPGLRVYVAAEDMAQRRNANALNQAQGIFGLQQAMESAPLEMELKRAQVERARNPVPIRQDVGNEILLLDPRNGAVMGRIQKGATPDATLRESGAAERHMVPSGSAELGSQTAIRGQDIGAQTAARGQVLTQRGQDQPVWDAERGVFVPRPSAQPVPSMPGQPSAVPAAPPGAVPIPGVKPRAEIQRETDEAKRREEVGRSLNAYVQARNGLLAGLSQSVTGPVLGRSPAFTSEQQIASGAVSAMAPVLKQIFRVAGEGVFTDRDQQLLLDMVPDRTDEPEARASKMANIDRIVAAKLGMPVPPPPSDELSDDDLINKYLPKPKR